MPVEGQALFPAGLSDRADMHPTIVRVIIFLRPIFQDQLVVVEVVKYKLSQFLIRHARNLDVCRLTFRVLAAPGTAYLLVEFLGPVTAARGERPIFKSYWLQDRYTQVPEAFYVVLGGLVANSQP